jgi:hypothetical protein
MFTVFKTIALLPVAAAAATEDHLGAHLLG